MSFNEKLTLKFLLSNIILLIYSSKIRDILKKEFLDVDNKL
jgi:hypothetical protein